MDFTKFGTQIADHQLYIRPNLIIHNLSRFHKHAFIRRCCDVHTRKLSTRIMRRGWKSRWTVKVIFIEVWISVGKLVSG